MYEYDYETLSACLKLLRDMFMLQPGETIAITTDDISDKAIVEATAQAAVILGAKPIIMKIAAPEGGKAGDKDMPYRALVDGIKACDAWIEYNTKLIFYSSVYDEIVADPNHRPRYLNQNGVKPDMMVRIVGKVDNALLNKFIQGFSDYLEAGTEMRFTTPAGTDLVCRNKKGREYVTADGFIRPGEIKMCSGQISWSPDFESINGVLVTDGTLSPPVGKLTSPVKFTIENGWIKKIEGGQDAATFSTWLKSFNDPNMYLIAHSGLGFGPTCELRGDIVEDERVWGCTEWGIGNVGPQLVSDMENGIAAASHSDGICLNCSLWVDGVQVLDNGNVVGPTEEYVELAHQLGH